MIAAFCVWFGLACAYAERDLPMPIHPKPAASMSLNSMSMNKASMNVEPLVAASMFPVDCDVQPPDEYKNDFVAASRRHGVDECLLAHQTRQESAFNPEALSPVGAEGISQFMPPTSKELGVDPWDPRESIMAQGRYLKWCMDRWSPTLYGRTEFDIEALGLVCYNWGLGSMYASQREHGWGLYVEGEPYFPDEATHYVIVIAGRGDGT